ncbi:DUF3243 domain-containing protein [Cohnella cholangitidis]|uniref:DUF3243 domain-containing protein n=1 Tax=Cohnella cholangitidis TaxID=2598458 RepID=A0A7G5BY00_9BACL|nr:DUF3243 domain-containing protein [Cohnella cholangitidis]QMV41834.1 DUF3243 domain-containing protein [Cohnella cholangitidis]
MTEHNHVVGKDGDVNPSQVAGAISRIDSSEKERILKNFEEFKGYLGKRIKMAENMGMGEEQIAKIAQKVADYLASHEEPRNSEEHLLQELWKVGTKDEQHNLAHMLVRLAQSEIKH